MRLLSIKTSTEVLFPSFPVETHGSWIEVFIFVLGTEFGWFGMKPEFFNFILLTAFLTQYGFALMVNHLIHPIFMEIKMIVSIGLKICLNYFWLNKSLWNIVSIGFYHFMNVFVLEQCFDRFSLANLFDWKPRNHRIFRIKREYVCMDEILLNNFTKTAVLIFNQLNDMYPFRINIICDDTEHAQFRFKFPKLIA